MDEVFVQGGLVSTEVPLQCMEEGGVSQHLLLSLCLLSSVQVGGPGSAE